MIKEMEDHGSNLGAVSFSLFRVPKNEPARVLYEKLGYQEDDSGRSSRIKYSKMNQD